MYIFIAQSDKEKNQKRYISNPSQIKIIQIQLH